MMAMVTTATEAMVRRLRMLPMNAQASSSKSWAKASSGSASNATSATALSNGEARRLHSDSGITEWLEGMSFLSLVDGGWDRLPERSSEDESVVAAAG